MDENGNIKSFKLYDKGKEIDLNKHQLEIKQEEQDGAKHEYMLLDGKKFGTEIITGADGTQKAAFWDSFGLINGSEQATIGTSTVHADDYTPSPLRPEYQEDLASRAELKASLKSQTGELPTPTAENTSKQLRLDMHIKAHENNRPDEVNGKKAIKENKRQDTNTLYVPIWQQQNTH